MKSVSSDILKETLTKIKSKIPTSLSQLENDSNLISKKDITVKQVITSGTEIAKVNDISIYAPQITISPGLTSGTEIATINGVKLYARKKKQVSVKYTFKIDSQFSSYEKTKNITYANGTAKSCSYTGHEWTYVDSGDKWGYQFKSCWLSNIKLGSATLNCDYIPR